MTSRQAIIQANIAFMYGRDEEAARHDPDKRKLLPSSSHSSSTKTIGSYYHKKKIDEKEAVKGFSGEWAFLAADFECEVHLKGSSLVFPSMEHALQASRTNDTALQSEISQIKDTREMKRTAMRLFKKNEKWNEISPDIAAQLLRDKFFRHKDLCRKLMATEHRSLVNVNTYNDKFWGVCDGFGQNKLGELLEKVRALHEQGKLRDYWIRDHFELEDSDKISVEVTVEKHGHVLSEYCEKVERKNLISIGKSDDNDVLLDHPTTSRVHAMLLADRNRGLLLIDLGAANGTRVDGKPVPPMTPMAIASSKIIVQFAASSREYTFSYDSEADKKRKEGLYARLAASNQDDSTTKGGKTSFSSPETTVFVGNLSYMSTENDLRSFFSTCGEVASIHLPKDRHSGESRGIAFVTFEKPAGLLQALSRDGDELQGRELKIKKSENNSSKSSKLSKASQFPSSSRSKDYSGGDAGHYGPGKSPSRAFPREKSAERRGDGKSERFSRSRSRSASPRARDMRDRGRDSGRGWRRSRERTEARADRHGHSHYGNSDRHSRSASRSSVSRSPQSRDSYRDRGWRRSRDRGVDRHRRHSRSPSRSASRSSSRSASRSRDRDRGRRARERSGRGGRSRANRHSRSPSRSSSRSRSASLERSYKRRRKKRSNSRGRSFSGDSRSDKS